MHIDVGDNVTPHQQEVILEQIQVHGCSQHIAHILRVLRHAHHLNFDALILLRLHKLLDFGHIGLLGRDHNVSDLIEHQELNRVANVRHVGDLK